MSVALKQDPSFSALNHDRAKVLTEALRWSCDALAYHLAVQDDETAAVIVEVARSFVQDDAARYAFGSMRWHEQVRRLRMLAARLGPAASLSPAFVANLATVYRREAGERLGLASVTII